MNFSGKMKKKISKIPPKNLSPFFIFRIFIAAFLSHFAAILKLI
jgi:hypothetical protein